MKPPQKRVIQCYFIGFFLMCFLAFLFAGCDDSDTTGPISPTVNIGIGDHGEVEVVIPRGWSDQIFRRKNGFTVDGVAEGDDLIIKFLPDDGFTLVDVKIDGISVEPKPEMDLTLQNIVDDHDIYITFGALKGDVTGDLKVDLADALVGLKTLASLDDGGKIRPHYSNSGADVNKDDKIGSTEVIYILHKVAGLDK